MIVSIAMNNQKFIAAVENAAKQNFNNFMDTIMTLSTSITRNFPAKAKGIEQNVSAVETYEEASGCGNNTCFYCNGVRVNERSLLFSVK